MFGDVFLLERNNAPAVRAERLAFGETAGRNEAWLRDTLFAHPDLLPVRDIDSSFGPLIPLCKELNTEAGPLDIAFINPSGRLTLVECKLWRNPESRRKVVAQALDYARAITSWSYADLQRQVAIASGRSGNVPFELAKERDASLSEQRFVDDTARAMRAGRFLLIIAGDGIQEGVAGIADLINRNATSAFSFGLVEVALYGFDGASLAIQPRVIAKTQLIERTVIMGRDAGGGTIELVEQAETDDAAEAADSADAGYALGESPRQVAFRAWWKPVIEAGFDDPEQEPAKLYFPNNIRAPLPWPKVWATAYRGDGVAGVYLAGSEPSYSNLISMLAPDRDLICAELPDGTEFRKFSRGDGHFFITRRNGSEFASDDHMRRWLVETLNAYVNVFRPKLKALKHSSGPA